MKRKIAVVFALLISWACYAIAARAWINSESQRCQQFGDLAAECIAPQGVSALVLAVAFAAATILLGWLAMTPFKSDRN